MKKRNLLCVFGALAALTLASCGNNAKTPADEPSKEKTEVTEQVTPEKTEEKTEEQTQGYDAEALVATFEDSIDTTVKLTYNVSFDVDVTREGNDATNFDSFKHQTRSTTEVEMDLGEDLYIKVSKTTKDLLVSAEETKVVELLYKKDSKYYYVTDSSTEEVEVAAADARTKVGEILAAVSYELVGSISVDTLLYNSTDKYYELYEFALTETFMPEDLVDPVYSANANGGLHVVYKPEYVGYKTDGGWSDFPAAEGKDAAATIEIDTNNKGYVTSWSEEYNAALVFNIMSNPPLVTINGERSFTATYGEAITKVSQVAAAPSVLAQTATTNGSYIVQTCLPNDWANLVTVADGGSLEMGKLVCVKPTPAEGYEVESVTMNGAEPSAVAMGYYCFAVTPGTNEVVVKFKATTQAIATINIVAPENGTVKVTYIDYNNGGAAAPQTEIQNGGTIDLNAGAMWLVFAATPAQGYELDKITVNGQAASNYGTWLFSLSNKEVLEYNVVVTFKATGSAGDENSSVVTFSNPTNGTIAVQSFDLNGQQVSNFQNVAQGATLAKGQWIGIKVTPAEGYVVGKVYANNEEVTMFMGGMYCYQVKGGALNITATTIDEDTLPLLATINIATPENGTVKVTYIDYNNGGAAAPQTEIQNGGTIDLNAGAMWLVFAVTPASGYVLDTITVNGQAAANYGTWLFSLKDKTVLEYNVVVTFKAA